MTEPIRQKYKIVAPGDIEEERMSVLYVGPEKSGKTHNICSWPKPLVISWDPNLATLRKFGVDYVAPATWKEFQWEILPDIQNRKLDYETICVDSWSFAWDALVAEVKGPGHGAKMAYDKWGEVFDKGISAVKVMADAAKPDPYNPDRRTYHIACTCHEKVETDADGAIRGIGLSVAGQAKDRLGRFFNTVLSTKCETGYGEGGVRTSKYVAFSVPPDPFRVAGDGVGGGKYKVLPAKLEPGTYQELMKGWGMVPQS